MQNEVEIKEEMAANLIKAEQMIEKLKNKEKDRVELNKTKEVIGNEESDLKLKEEDV